MRATIEIDVEAILPEPPAILAGMGMPLGSKCDEKTTDTLDRALHLFSICADPRGLYSEISARQFAEVYDGEGENELATPVADLYPRADHLALFAVTMGEEVSSEIVRLFGERRLAVAAALDAAASEAAERAGDLLQRSFLEGLVEGSRLRRETAVVRHGPGSCGWHVSGQGKLVQSLGAGEIGITLLQGFLMEPLKSISGVLLAGSPEIHDFRPTYPSCRFCDRPVCRERARSAPRAGSI
jgi:hypothetical protein